MHNFFVILGGMGTLATESFVHLLNSRTPAKNDQEYLNYLIVNHAQIPDRTAFIKDKTADDPRPMLLEDIQSFEKLHPDFFVLTCNTAHYFFEDLQNKTTIPILHMPKLAVTALTTRYPNTTHPTVIFLGTEGSLLSGIYQSFIEQAGYTFLAPDTLLQQEVNTLIYEDIKNHNHLNLARFHRIVSALLVLAPDAIILLGCTELSYLYEAYKQELTYSIIDAQSEVIDYILAHRSSND